MRLHRLRHLVGRCDAVGQHVMNLVNDRDPVVGQTLDDVHLPQRTTAVQRRAGDLADQLIEFTAPTGCGHTLLVQVIVEVDVVVFHPHRVMQLQRDVDELVAQRRQGHQPRIRHLPEQIEVEAVDTRHVEHADLQRVHVDLGRLAVQHQRVHAVESLHIPPRSPTNSLALCPPLHSFCGPVMRLRQRSDTSPRICKARSMSLVTGRGPLSKDPAGWFSPPLARATGLRRTPSATRSGTARRPHGDRHRAGAVGAPARPPAELCVPGRRDRGPSQRARGRGPGFRPACRGMPSTRGWRKAAGSSTIRRTRITASTAGRRIAGCASPSADDGSGGHHRDGDRLRNGARTPPLRRPVVGAHRLAAAIGRQAATATTRATRRTGRR